MKNREDMTDDKHTEIMVWSETLPPGWLNIVMDLKGYEFVYTSKITGFKVSGIIWAQNRIRNGEIITDYIISTEGVCYKVDDSIELCEKLDIDLPDYKWLIP